MSIRRKISNSYIRKFVKRNHKILNNSNRKTSTNTVNLHWWSMQKNTGEENIGDLLSVVVCEEMLKKKSLKLDTKVSSTKHLFAIGSIIQGGAQNATIWGSGTKNGLKDFPWYVSKSRKLDVRLVRGPLTREALLKSGYDCPDKYGDPALILPLFYKPKVSDKKEYGVILHHATNRKEEGSITPVGSSWEEFVDFIFNSKLIISSSLHGIIIAEAYGIPAILLSDTATENIFKYQDYYYSTGRKSFNIAHSIQEALSLIPNDIPDFDEIIKNILETFPYDLWE